jgi:NhaA family Na+:H+ antiporter
MSIFITLLAFDQDALIDQSKIIIMITSLLSGVAGFIFLMLVTGKQK